MTTPMTNQFLEQRLQHLVKTERRITQEILHLILEADDRKLYLDQAYGSLYDWLIQKFGYSQSAAHRRIQAARLLRAVPEVSEKIASGEVNLTTLTHLQSTLRKEERRIGKKVSSEAKLELVQKIEGKSLQEAEKILFAVFPEIPKTEDRLKITSSTQAQLSVSLDEKTQADLARAKELLSHVCPFGSWAEIIAYLADDFVKRRDPLQKAMRSEERRQA